jgi:DNA-directed RNA polymerase subunit RPC12/RpoP
MSAVDYDETYRCPVCSESATARVRHITAHQGDAYAVNGPHRCPNGCEVSKSEVYLAIGACPHCGARLRTRPSIEPSVAGGERDLVCSRHGVVGPA